MRTSFLAFALPVATLPGCQASASPANAPMPSERQAEFDRSTAISLVSDAAAEAQVCEKEDGPHGVFGIEVNYRNDGQVESAVISPPMSTLSAAPVRDAIDADVRRCVEQFFRKAVIPPFGGPAMTIRKEFTIRYCDGAFPPASPATARTDVDRRRCMVPEASSASQSPPTSAPSCTFNFNSKTAGTKVVLDDRPLGVIPQSGIRVSAGWHRLRYEYLDGQRAILVKHCPPGSVVKFNTR